MEDGASGCGWGLALLIDRGMVTWMQAWPEIAGGEDPEASARSRYASTMPEGSAAPSLPSTSYQQLAAILASMILETRKEVLP
jgi:hypothetical protein